MKTEPSPSALNQYSGPDTITAADDEPDRTALATLDAFIEIQGARRAELGDYLSQLETRVCEDGSKLVELPVNWLLMVEKMLRERRGEYSTLQGWMGPRRYEGAEFSKQHAQFCGARLFS